MYWFLFLGSIKLDRFTNSYSVDMYYSDVIILYENALLYEAMHQIKVRRFIGNLNLTITQFPKNQERIQIRVGWKEEGKN